jgi:hypothetical protein
MELAQLSSRSLSGLDHLKRILARDGLLARCIGRGSHRQRMLLDPEIPPPDRRRLFGSGSSEVVSLAPAGHPPLGMRVI